MEKKAPARHRQRATAACIGCRRARIRCVRDTQSQSCDNCLGNSADCVFDEKDGRKSRASVKAVESALMRRIQSLEAQLRQARGANARRSGASPGSVERPPPYASPDGSATSMPLVEDENQDHGQAQSTEPPSSVVTKLMPSSIRFDMASGRVRYFGSTTHLNVLSRMAFGKAHQKAPSQSSHWPICLVVRDLSPSTHDYLMGLFWTLHNSVIRLVHSDPFHRDQDNGSAEFYSTFLHMTILATGFRYADKTRDDIRRLALPGYATSTLHEKAKAMAKLEMEKPGGIPSIQAFQLLGGLEFCCGNDDTGWLFTGMCFRLVFDAGLHVDRSPPGITERDSHIRHMVLWACITTDRLWSLYLGRPTTIKTSDIAPTCLSFDFGPMMQCQPESEEKGANTRIYETLLQMMELVSQICDLRGPRPPSPADMYFRLAAIDQQLRDWHSNLPVDLQWSMEKHVTMPPAYYLLHTQYHAAVILLHRPFVRYADKSETEITNHFTSLSRNSCAESAKRIASVFEKYASRFDLGQVYGTAVQHGGTAATALMTEVILQTDDRQRDDLLEKLGSLRQTIELMSRNYQPAGHMASVVDQFIRSVRNTQGSGGEESGTGLQMDQSDVRDGPDVDGMPVRKRVRGDNNPFSFTPTCPGARSPTGLPFLPSLFLEGLIADESVLFDDVPDMGEPFSWDYGTR